MDHCIFVFVQEIREERSYAAAVNALRHKESGPDFFAFSLRAVHKEPNLDMMEKRRFHYMSKITEKAINGLHQFLEEHGGADSEEELQELLDQYMMEYNNSLRFQPPLSEATAKTSNDWLELAENADTANDALRLARKSLSLDPNNYDAELFILSLKNELPHIQLEQLNGLIEKATEHMKESGHIPDDVGEFWMVHGTRPYIRLLAARMYAEKQSGMLIAAIRDAEEMIRLNKSDNMGIRMPLMSLYSLLLKETEAEALLEQFNQDGYVETGLFLPLSILYFRLGKLDRAKETLLQLNEANHDAKKFFRAVINNKLERYADVNPEAGYRPNTIEEFIIFMQEEPELLSQSAAYIMWADDVLKHQSGAKMKSRKKKR